MKIAKKPANEAARLEDLKELNILDTPISKNFERITKITQALFNVPMVAISLLDNERQWLKSTQGINACETSREDSFCSYAILQDEFFIIKDTLKDDRFVDNPFVTGDPHIRFYAGYPIKSKKGNNLGALCIIDTQPRNFTMEQLNCLKDMAGMTENELQNQRNKYLQSELIQELDETKRKSLTDPLTRLWNRAGIENLLFKQIALSRSLEKGFGLAMVDIDNFKQVNDTYGHAAGDQTLRHLSKLFIDTLRENDAVGRWGGEEFLIVIDVSEKETLRNIVERLRTRLQDTPVQYEGNTINITITIGLIFVDPAKNKRTVDLVESADKALYQGKNSGKNKVVFAE